MPKWPGPPTEQWCSVCGDKWNGRKALFKDPDYEGLAPYVGAFDGLYLIEELGTETFYCCNRALRRKTAADVAAAAAARSSGSASSQDAWRGYTRRQDAKPPSADNISAKGKGKSKGRQPPTIDRPRNVANWTLDHPKPPVLTSDELEADVEESGVDQIDRGVYFPMPKDAKHKPYWCRLCGRDWASFPPMQGVHLCKWG